MLFLHEVKSNDVEEYRTLDKKFEGYFKEIGLHSDAITKWFSDYPYPLCIRSSFEDGKWYNQYIYSKEEYYYFLDRVAFCKSEDIWFSWFFTSLKGIHRLKLRMCNDVEAMEQARKTFTNDLYYCTACLLKDMGLPLTFVENGTVMYYKRDKILWN